MILPTQTGGDDATVDTPTPAPNTPAPNTGTPKIDLQAAIRTLFPNGMPGEGPTGPAVEAGATGGSGSPDGWSGRARELVGSVARAVLGHESDDDYTARNKASGDTALGAYQIMDYNVGPWTKQYLGHAMTPAEFAQDKQAQDTVATARLQDYLTTNLAKTNGDVEKAIRLTSYDWYGHNGGHYDSPAYSKKSKSITGPSPNDYADDVIDRYHKIAGSAAADTTTSAPADATASGDSSLTGASQGQAAPSTSLPLDPNTPLPSPGQITSSKPQPAAATYFDRMIGNLDQQDDQAEAQQAATAQAQKEEADRQTQDKATQFAQAINHLAGGMQFVPGHGPIGQAPVDQSPIPAGGLHPIDPGQAKDTRTLKDAKQIPISESAPAKGFEATSVLMSALVGGESEGVVGSLNPAGGLLLHFASLNPATAELTRAGLEGVNALALNIPAATFPQSYQQLKDVVSSGNPTADAAADFVGSTGGSLYGISKIEQALAHIAPGASAATRTGLTFAAQNAPDIISKTVDGKLTPLQGLGMLGMGYVEGSLFSKVGDVNKSLIDNSLSTGEQKAVQAFQGGVLQAPVSVATEFAKKGISGEKITGTDIAQSAGFGAAFGAMQGAHVEGEHNSDPLAAKIDEKAHEAATSPMNDRPEPTVAQKNAGNYKMGHVTMQGLDISIENPAGSERSGNGPDGPWSVAMKNHYGYIKGTEGADGDHVDTFIGPNPKSDKVFVVDQVDASKPNADDATGAYAGRAFDEHKVILGANTRGEALKIYRDNYSDDATARIGAVSETNIGDFKEWLKSGDKSQPFNFEMRAEGPVPTVRDNAPIEANAEPSNASESNAPEPAAAAPEESAKSDERPGIPLYSEGREQQLRLANGEKKPVRYALAESDDVQLSHNEQTFEPNEKYAGENQNNYHDDPAQQAVVVEGGHDTDWNIIHSTTSSAIEGPTFVDPFGMAAGGNGRGMMVKRAYAERPEETKAQVVKDAENFGLDPSVAEGMQKPMVVRVQPDVVTRDAESARNIADLNQTNTKQRTPTVEGVYLAKRLNDQNRTQLAEAMTSIENMSELTQSANKARPIINMLREVGQITKANQNEYISSDGTLTPKGRETVEGLSLGMALPDAQLIGRLPDSFRQKMVENLRPIGAAEAIKGWELHDNFARIADYAEARKRYIEQGGVKEQYDNQASLLSDESRPQLNSEDRLLLGLLDDPKRTRFRDFMQSYAQNAAIGREGAIDIMGDTMTRERAFANARDAFASGSYRASSSSGGSNGAARRGAIDTPLGEGSRPMPEADAKETMSDDAPRTPEEEQAAKDPVTGQDEARFRMPSAVDATVKAYQGARTEILKFFAPQRLSEEGRRTANMFRKNIAEQKRLWDIAFTTLQDAEADMDRAIGAAGGPEKGFSAGYDFTDRHERGLTQTNPVLQNASEVLKAEYDSLWNDLHATGRLEAYVENYLSRNWDRSQPGAEQKIADFNRTRSLEGSKSFLKQRVLEYQSDGINFGLKPADPNPIRGQYGAIQQMRKFIMAHKMWEQEAAYGTPKFMPVGQPTPEGYGEVDDTITKVFAPNAIEVKEGFDRKMMQGLENFATGLGFTHERVASLRGGKWGYAEKPGPDGRGHIVTRFAGSESALAHEIGHEVDWKYGMMKSMNSKPYIDRELAALAKERYSGNETLVSDAVKREADTSDERAATMFEAYAHAPELFKQTAPHAFAEFEKFLDAHPELSSFKDIKPSLVMGERTQSIAVGGRREMGRWVLPEASAQVINNYKSKSLRESSTIAKGVLNMNFLAAGFRLSFSWFHGPFTGINQVVTRVAASMYDGFSGRGKESMKNFAHAIVAPYADTKLGRQIGEEWRSPGMHPELADAVDRQVEGGGRDKMDSHIDFDSIRRLKIAARQKDFQGVGREAFGSAVQSWMYPIMEGLVPAAKHTSRLVIGESLLRDLPAGASIEEQRAALAKADDYTDAIFGQVTYANSFMHNKAKDVLFGLTQSLGWTKGSYTMFAGAIRDTGKFAYDAARAPFTHEAPKVTFPMTYAASLFAVHGLLSGMITLACTGAMPTETKDYFFPTIGRNRDGTKRRIALPTYVTVIAGLEQGGMKSIINATAYAPQMFAQLYNNRDYNNEKIYNSDDPFYTRVYDAARHVLTEGVEPYSVKNIAKLITGDSKGQKSSLWEKLGPLMGVKTAPFYVTRTPAESLAWEYLADSRPAGGYDKSQSARFEERKALRSELRDDRSQGMADLKDAQDKGLIKKGAASRSVIRSSQRTWLENVMDGMDFNKGANLYEIGNDDEKRHLGPQLEKKYHTALRDAGNPEDRARISERYTKLVGGNAIVAPNVTSSSGENASSEMIIH